MAVRFSFLLILIGLASGCSDDSYEGTEAEARSNYWRESIDMAIAVQGDDLSIDSLSATIEILGADEPLTKSSSGTYYKAVLETVKGEELPCGYADIEILVVLLPSGEVDTYGVGPGAICIYSDAQS